MRAEAAAGVNPVGTGARAIRIPSVFRCGIMILALKVALKARGFGWTIRWIRNRLDAVPSVGASDPGAVAAVECAVAMAGALYPGRALCLEQSLVLYYLLRQQGVPVKYCQGVQAHPFAAHAWVEYRGTPISDVAEHVKLFRRMPDQLP